MNYFCSGTLVLTKKGYQPIQNLSENDLVFTHNGKWKSIESTDNRSYNGVVVSIISAGSAVPIHSTAEHQFLTKQIIGTGMEINDYTLSQKVFWTPACSLKADKYMLCVPLEPTEIDVHININIEEESRTSLDIDWFMVGYFVGKGTRVLEIEFIPPGWSILREFTVNPTREIGHCNRIPEWVQRLPKHCIKSFVQGFESSAKKKNNNEFVVANELVALCMQRLYAKLNLFVSIQVHEHIVSLKPMNNAMFDEKYMYIPIQSVSDEFKELRVFSLDVSDDHSCVVENVATRN